MPTLGRNTLWSHDVPLVQENMCTKFSQYIKAIESGTTVRLAKTTINNPILKFYWGFLNVLLSAVFPHTFETSYDSAIIASVLQIPLASVVIAESKICKLLIEIVTSSKGKHASMHAALRILLVNPKYYQDLLSKVITGLVKLITVPVSERIAETHGSKIDDLHTRYTMTDLEDS